MTDRKTRGEKGALPWHARIVYYNLTDTRIFVPKQIGIGWTLNFAHPHVHRVLFWILTAHLILMGILLAAVRGKYMIAYPEVLLFPFAGILVAVALSLCAWQTRRSGFSDAVRATELGVLAALIGFSVQSILNYPVVLFLGKDTLTWRSHIYLALIAALAQTLGKFSMISAFRRIRPGIAPEELLAGGLLVGLGFTSAEIVLLWFGAVWHGSAPMDVFFIWERTSASLFHIYSCGLIAIYSLNSKRYPLLIVLTTHFAMDWLAGANQTLFQLPLSQMEAVFSMASVIVFLAFFVISRTTHYTSVKEMKTAN